MAEEEREPLYHHVKSGAGEVTTIRHESGAAVITVHGAGALPAGSRLTLTLGPEAPTTTTPAPPPPPALGNERGVVLRLTRGDLTTLGDGEPVQLRVDGVSYLITVTS